MGSNCRRRKKIEYKVFNLNYENFSLNAKKENTTWVPINIII